MKFKKFKKIVSKYFEDGRAEKINKTWFNAWVKSSYNKIKDAPSFQVQYKNKLWWVGGVSSKSLDTAFISWLERNREWLDSEKCILKGNLNYFYGRWAKLKYKLSFTKIIHNKKKATTVVWFLNGDKVIVKRRKGAVDDVYTAVAFAITRQLFKTNAKYQRCVDYYLEEKK